MKIRCVIRVTLAAVIRPCTRSTLGRLSSLTVTRLTHDFSFKAVKVFATGGHEYNMNESIGEMIASGRKSKNLTQARLAEMLHVSPQAVGKWERGESLPDVFMLAKISKIIGWTPNCLLTPEKCSCGNCKWCCAAHKE